MSVTVTTTIAETGERVTAARRLGKTIGLVPTMGALHAGHVSLIERARRDTGWCSVSIFVNPLQFAPNEDYSRYPRDLEADLRLCSQCGVDHVFAPEVDAMYPLPQLTTVEVARISEHLCGESRPGHFRGVTTLVLKLLNILQPDVAYFGEKDAQQLAVIRRMVADLNVGVKIVGLPTVREPDGLAVSSRNNYLNPAERQAATVLYRALQLAQSKAATGERIVARLKAASLSMIHAEPLVRTEYFEIVNGEDLQPVKQITVPALALGAICIGSTRLIDNMSIAANTKLAG